MLKINSVVLSPNPVNVSQAFIVQIKIITWDSLKAEYTWEQLKNSGENWNTLLNKAVDRDMFARSWNEVMKKYGTWNSIKRNNILSWNELKGDEN